VSTYVEPAPVPVVDRLLLDVASAARVMGISRSLLYELLSRGELPSIRIASRRLVPRQSIEDFIARALARPAEGEASR
jgi:excisionase family DNA binding protein